ncbi:hypothetical protein BH11PSE1_BH11PSE1_16410 [soil metagenome]
MFSLNPGPALAGAAAIFTAGVLAATFTPFVGANARVGRAQHQVQAWRGHAENNRLTALAYAKRAGESEGLRKLEVRASIAAVDHQAAACVARIAQARRSAAAISLLTHKEPTRDPNGCPVRQLLDPRQLRDALRPPS